MCVWMAEDYLWAQFFISTYEFGGLSSGDQTYVASAIYGCQSIFFFLNIDPDYPVTHYIVQADLKLTQLHLPLPLPPGCWECWDTQFLTYF